MSEREAGYRAIVEHFPNGMVAIFDHDLRYTVIDGEGLRAVGMRSEDLVGKRLREVFPPDVADRDEPLLRLTLQGETTESKVTYGDQHFRIITAPVYDAGGNVVSGLVMSQNITSLVSAVEDRERMAEELSLAVDTARLGIWSFDLATQRLHWNEHMFEIYDVDPDSFGGRLDDFRARLHPEDRAEVDRQFAAIENVEKIDELDFRILTPRGELRRIHASGAVRRDGDGNVKALMGVNLDVTETWRRSVQLRQAQRLEALGRLTGGVAHDLNNLLQVITSQGHDLARAQDLDTDGARAAVADVLEACERAERLVGQLMAFGRRQLQGPKILDLGQVVESSLHMLKTLIGETITVCWQPSDEAVMVRAELGLVEQVVMNLCLNARDAMPNGGTLTLRVTPIDLESHDHLPAGSYVALEVGDTGVGMAEEVASRVFEPFFTTKEPGGTGLGLSSVYGIVQQHHGDITLESVEGRGTLFRVLWPRTTDEDPPSEVDDEVAPSVEGLTILLAEDDRLVRRGVVRSLRGAGHRILEAGHGGEALDILGQHAGAIDLVVLDVIMPVMGGVEAYEALRRTHPQLPVVFISGYNEADLTRYTQGDLPAALLLKPFTPADLLRKIATTIQSGVDARRGSSRDAT